MHAPAPVLLLCARAAALAAPGSSCAGVQHDIGLRGTNLPQSYDDATQNVTRCCAACDGLPECVGWTLDPVNKKCWLKSSTDSTASTDHVSGLKPVAPPSCGNGPCPNILYLMADDMRSQLGCYGHSYMQTPNIDALAKGGLQFDFAYTQFAYCAPSRNSFMSGRRPERTKALNFQTTFRKQHGDAWVAMPQFFKNHGYFTTSAGKLYHDGMDDPASWSYPSNQTHWIQCQAGDVRGINNNFCGVTAQSKVPYTDEDMILAEGLKRMDLAAAQPRPWWVSIGIHRPHHSSRVPVGFYGDELYPNGTGDVVLPPAWPYAPIDAPWMSGNWYAGDYSDPAHGCPNCSVPSERSVEYRRWYYAAVTYADHMLGKALDKLDQLGLTQQTITVFHADHGYQLGELNEWSKKTDTDLAVHVPLIVRVPARASSHGQRTTVLAELVDMYRTLADLAGLGGVQDDVQGTSLAAAFDAPASPPAALAAKRAFSQIGSCACKTYTRSGWTGRECDAGRCIKTPVPQFDYMGYSMRTPEWRFTAWVSMDNTTSRVDWTLPVEQELYDLRGDDGRDFDFGGYSRNVAADPQHAAVVAALRSELQAAVASWY